MKRLACSVRRGGLRRYLLLAGLTILAFAFAQMASAATTYYVTTNGTGNLSGTNWANATNSLQGAIDAIDPGAANTVWVSNGVYEVGGRTNYPAGTLLTNRVAIWKAITVRSANNDPTNTIIKGNSPNGPAAVRCVYMTNDSSLIGFMLTNGATLAGEAGEVSGGGARGLDRATTTISNCIVTGNSAGYIAGGTYRVTLNNCTLTSNSTQYGGAAGECSLNNCTLNGNSAQIDGGGAHASSLYNCTLTSNSSARYGTRASSLTNCTLIGNSTRYGGGAYNSSLYNCTLIHNSASEFGGGAHASSLYNCTIVSNSAGDYGGGVEGGTLYNCISWNNNKVDSGPNANYSCGVGYTNGGSVSGNITNNPLFADSGAGNYRLSANSPCVNTGTNFSWMIDPADPRSKDLDERARIRYGIVDMGAYERINEGTIYIAH